MNMLRGAPAEIELDVDQRTGSRLILSRRGVGGQLPAFEVNR